MSTLPLLITVLAKTLLPLPHLSSYQSLQWHSYSWFRCGVVILKLRSSKNWFSWTIIGILAILSATPKIFFLHLSKSKGFIKSLGTQHSHREPHLILKPTKKTIQFVRLKQASNSIRNGFKLPFISNNRRSLFQPSEWLHGIIIRGCTKSHMHCLNKSFSISEQPWILNILKPNLSFSFHVIRSHQNLLMLWSIVVSKESIWLTNPWRWIYH